MSLFENAMVIDCISFDRVGRRRIGWTQFWNCDFASVDQWFVFSIGRSIFRLERFKSQATISVVYGCTHGKWPPNSQIGTIKSAPFDDFGSGSRYTCTESFQNVGRAKTRNMVLVRIMTFQALPVLYERAQFFWVVWRPSKLLSARLAD